MTTFTLATTTSAQQARPTIAQRVSASIREDVRALERELAVWKGEADRAKDHNESEEVRLEAVDQSEFFAAKIKSLTFAISSLKG